MGNTSWFNGNSPVTYFDFNANGISPILYTVVDVNVISTQKNVRRVYKYETDVSLDIDLSGSEYSELETFNISFNSIKYCDFDISMNTQFPTTSGVWKYNELLNNTVISNETITWGTASTSDYYYISWAFGNHKTSRDMLIELFNVQDTQNKWVYLHMEPFVRYLNQFNLQVGSVSWDGSLTTPLVTTVPSLAKGTLNNDTYTIQQYSTLYQK
jgi:hypothetical protein